MQWYPLAEPHDPFGEMTPVGLVDDVDDARVEVAIVEEGFEVVDTSRLVEEEDAARLNEEEDTANEKEVDLMVSEGVTTGVEDVALVGEEEAGLGVEETEARADDDLEPLHLPKRGLQPVPQ
jgi:hypothetical protein